MKRHASVPLPLSYLDEVVAATYLLGMHQSSPCSFQGHPCHGAVSRNHQHILCNILLLIYA